MDSLQNESGESSETHPFTPQPRCRSPLRLASCGVDPWLPAVEAYAAKQEDLQLPAAGSLCPYPRSSSPGRRAQQLYGTLLQLQRQRQTEGIQRDDDSPPPPSPSQQQRPPPGSSPPLEQQDQRSQTGQGRPLAGQAVVRRCPSPPPTHVSCSRAVSPPRCPALAEAVKRSGKELALRRLVSSASAAARPSSRLVALLPEDEAGEGPSSSGSSRSRSGGGCVLSFGRCFVPVMAGADACRPVEAGHRDELKDENSSAACTDPNAATSSPAKAGGDEQTTSCMTDGDVSTHEPHATSQQQQQQEGEEVEEQKKGDGACSAAATSSRHVEWAENVQPTPASQRPLVAAACKGIVDSHISSMGGWQDGGCGNANMASSHSSSSSCVQTPTGDVVATPPAPSGAAAPKAADTQQAADLNPARILADLAGAAGLLPGAQVVLLDTSGRPHTCPAACSSGPLWEANTWQCTPARTGTAAATAGPCAGSNECWNFGQTSGGTKYTSSNREVPILGAACSGWTTCTLLEPRAADPPPAAAAPHSHTSSMRPGHSTWQDTGLAAGAAGRLHSSRRQAAAVAGPPHLDQASTGKMSTMMPAEAASKAAGSRAAGGKAERDLPRASTKVATAASRGATQLLGSGGRETSPRRRRQASSLRQRTGSSSTLAQRSGQGATLGAVQSALEQEVGSNSHQLVVPAYSSQGGYAYGIYESETGILYYD